MISPAQQPKISLRIYFPAQSNVITYGYVVWQKGLHYDMHINISGYTKYLWIQLFYVILKYQATYIHHTK